MFQRRVRLRLGCESLLSLDDTLLLLLLGAGEGAAMLCTLGTGIHPPINGRGSSM